MTVNFHEFYTQSKEDWIAKASQDLKGKIDANFLYCVEENFYISSFQTQNVAIKRAPIMGPMTKSGVIIPSSPLSNSIALRLLDKGAEAIFFDVTKDTNYDVLFEGIYLDMITVILSSAHDIDELKLNEYISKNYKDKEVYIIIKNQKNSISHKTIVLTLNHTDSFKIRMSNVTSFVNSVVSSGNYKKVIIEVSLKKDFLAQVAELRAMRIIWSRIIDKNKLTFYPLTIMTNLDIMGDNINEVHPLIKVNYLLMSAYLGMSDVAFGLPCIGDLELSRLCLNIHHMFKEESFLAQVSDPTCGSYAIESLTEQMINFSL